MGAGECWRSRPDGGLVQDAPQIAPWPYDAEAHATGPWVLIEHAKALQKQYRERRRRWAWKIGRPYSEDTNKPFPGVHDLADEEVG